MPAKSSDNGYKEVFADAMVKSGCLVEVGATIVRGIFGKD